MNPTIKSQLLRETCLEAARRGLEFLIRHQAADRSSADHGRFAYVYDCEQEKVLTRTTNWTTGVAIESLLLGYQMFQDARYLDAAGRGADYLRSLQEFSPTLPRLAGTFHEETPQSEVFHPRDALTAAWALLDWSEVSRDDDARMRATHFADWLIDHGMDAGYPRWTVSYRTFEAQPRWYGSFHSGGAFFLARMHAVTGEPRYLCAMKQILDIYNRLHLAPDGRISVIVDIAGQTPVPDQELPAETAPPVGWIRMHEYNDDFGALANIEAFRLTGDNGYLHAGECFLERMMAIQRGDGGFGPPEYSVPAAGGSVLIELLAAKSCGSALPTDEAVQKAVQYVLGLQISQPGAASDGAFLGFTDNYTMDSRISNIRAGSYAIIALLRFAGAVGSIYFPQGAISAQ